MISFGSCIYPTLGSAKVSPNRVASPENYKHQTLKVSGVTHRPELPPITLLVLSPHIGCSVEYPRHGSSSLVRAWNYPAAIFCHPVEG